MQGLYKLAKGLETVSGALQNIPEYVYAVILGITALFIILYYVVVPQCHLSEHGKNRFKNYIGWMVLAFYLIIVLLITVFTREANYDYGVNLKFLHSILNFTHINREIISDILNTILFLPVGAFLYYRIKGKNWWLKVTGMSFGFSLLIELIQLIFKLGYFDVNDLFFNTLGGILGYFMFCLWYRIMAREGWLKKVVKVLFVILSVIIGLCCVLFAIYHFMRVRGMEVSQINISHIENQMTSKENAGTMVPEELLNDPEIIWYDGKAYRYNENLTTILGMGIDQRTAYIEQKYDVSGEGGQADTIFLIVMDSKTDEMKMLSLSRDIMCAVKTFDYRGNYIGESKNHLGLAYSFGDGKHVSCQYMVDAVSNLLYGMPIHAYLALNMEAIQKINDAIGGVTVECPQDLTQIDDAFVKGEKITLKGRQALLFIRWRDVTQAHSNQLRMERQKIYIKNLMPQALSAIKKDLLLPVKIYNDLDKEMVTNISVEQVTHYATEVFSMKLDTSEIVSVKGEPKVGSVYDEFYVDEDALYKLVIDTFYVEVPFGEEE